jgi:hypothetical protein
MRQKMHGKKLFSAQQGCIRQFEKDVAALHTAQAR